MSNKAYIKGCRKERKILNDIAKSQGFKNAREANKNSRNLVLSRSAGSHSRVDCFFLDTKLKRAYLYQAKPDSMSESAKQKIIFACADIPGTYEVFFEVV